MYFFCFIPNNAVDKENNPICSSKDLTNNYLMNQWGIKIGPGGIAPYLDAWWHHNQDGGVPNSFISLDINENIIIWHIAYITAGGSTVQSMGLKYYQIYDKNFNIIDFDEFQKTVYPPKGYLINVFPISSSIYGTLNSCLIDDDYEINGEKLSNIIYINNNMYFSQKIETLCNGYIYSPIPKEDEHEILLRYSSLYNN